MRNQRGQAVLEVTLLCLLVMGVWLTVSKTLQKNGTFDEIFGKPWVRLSNTIEYGVPSDKKNLGSWHPAHKERHSTRVEL